MSGIGLPAVSHYSGTDQVLISATISQEEGKQQLTCSAGPTRPAAAPNEQSTAHAALVLTATTPDTTRSASVGKIRLVTSEVGEGGDLILRDNIRTIWSFTVLPSSSMVLILKSTPIVLM